MPKESKVKKVSFAEHDTIIPNNTGTVSFETFEKAFKTFQESQTDENRKIVTNLYKRLSPNDRFISADPMVYKWKNNKASGLLERLIDERKKNKGVRQSLKELFEPSLRNNTIGQKYRQMLENLRAGQEYDVSSFLPLFDKIMGHTSNYPKTTSTRMLDYIIPPSETERSKDSFKQNHTSHPLASTSYAKGIQALLQNNPDLKPIINQFILKELRNYIHQQKETQKNQKSWVESCLPRFAGKASDSQMIR